MELGPPVRPTILVVDDDTGLRDSLHLILDDEYEVVVGVDLGIHASLTVLLRSRCRVEQLPNVDEALGHASVLPPDVLIVNWDSLGSQAIEIVGWMRRLSPDPLLVVIGSGSLPDEPSLGPCVPLIAPARVSFLLKEIRAH